MTLPQSCVEEMRAAALEAVRDLPQHRLGKRRAPIATEAIYFALVPYMEGVFRWWAFARPEETPASYARRAADLAAKRLGAAPDAAIRSSAAWLARHGGRVEP